MSILKIAGMATSASIPESFHPGESRSGSFDPPSPCAIQGYESLLVRRICKLKPAVMGGPSAKNLNSRRQPSLRQVQKLPQQSTNRKKRNQNEQQYESGQVKMYDGVE
jgi:hypothetical protein